MRDVEYLLLKGVYRLKALTPKAMGVFLQLLEMPEDAGTITEAFLHATESNGPRLLTRLQGLGLQTEPDQPSSYPKKDVIPTPAHLWEW